jgi:hypothetical protein
MNLGCSVHVLRQSATSRGQYELSLDVRHVVPWVSRFEGPFGAYRFDFVFLKDWIRERRHADQDFRNGSQQWVWEFAGVRIAGCIDRNTVQSVLFKCKSVCFLSYNRELHTA